MKKIYYLLILFIIFLFSCTEKPEGPRPEEPSNYSILISPKEASAFVNTDEIITQDEIIPIEVTVKKNNVVYTKQMQVTFVTQGAYFYESMSNEYLAVTDKGKARASLFSNYPGEVKVEAYLKGEGVTSGVSTTGKYTFYYDTGLKITSISPTTGSTKGGETVSIYGNGFIFPLEVYFGEKKATYISNTFTEIQVTTPQYYSHCCGCNDVVDVKVVINPGQLTENSFIFKNGFTYLYEPYQPKITGIDPNHGTDYGGTLVTIYGEGFYCNEGVLVYFNDVPAKVINCKNNKIVVESPPAHDAGVQNCNQAVDIKVLNICGGLSATLIDGFRYGPEMKLNAISQTGGSVFGGDTVTIYGQGFDCPVAVTFAGIGQRIISCSNNEIVLITSSYYNPECKSKDGDIVITSINCGVSVICRNCWKYITPELYITSISPISGNFPGTISIYGAGFYPPFNITFGGLNALGYNWIDPTMIADVGIPPFSGTYPTEDCFDGAGCPGKRFGSSPVSIRIRSATTGCEASYESFFYQPPDTTCRTDAPKCNIKSEVSGCTISFTTDPACGATYNWTDLSGAISCFSSGNSYVCTYDSSGTKFVSLTVTNSGGSAYCSGSGKIEAGVNPACP